MKVYYFTDPMCSWCYGFSPIVKKLKENYPEIDLQIVSGGFSPSSKQKVDEEYREFLLFHWKNVEARSGQYFNHAMKFVSDTFCYDTEPSSRALTVMQTLVPGQDFEYLSLMQTAFYADGNDITDGDVLAQLATKLGANYDAFLVSFNSDEMKLKTRQGFQFSRRLGVRGFPTMLNLQDGKVTILTRGFATFDELKPIIDAQMASLATSEAGDTPSCIDGTCAY